MTDRNTVTYLLPIKSNDPPDPELTEYLRELSRLHEVLIVDGSAPAVFDAAHRAWSGFARHVAVDPAVRCTNGKVRGVLTGLALVDTDAVVIADDDVRFTAEVLGRCVDRLRTASLVHPQSYFDPLPWHARWDTARILLNRAVGHDMGGASVADMSVLRSTAGYDGDVLFENLELVRTVDAAGGTVVFADDLYVRRVPPTTSHFLSQRVRQAYDELARPARLLVQLALLPLAIVASRRRPLALLTGAVCTAGVAEVGRRRSGGARWFPFTASLLAPAWLAERAVCSWIAIAERATGGARYHGARVRRAATPARILRARHRGR